MHTPEVTRVTFTGATVDIYGLHTVPAELPDGLPGACYAPAAGESSDGDIFLSTNESRPELIFDASQRTVHVRAPVGELDDGVEMLYLAQGMAEGHRQTHGTFMLHAAATLDPNGRGHLLVGSPGSGKTVTTLALCLEQGHRLVGNDLVIISRADPGNQQMELREGTKYIHVRETALQANRFLGSTVLQDEMSGPAGMPSFMKKVRLDCEEVGIQTAEGDFPLEHVWHVWLDGRNQQAVGIVEQSRLIRSLFFSERMARHISGIVSPIKSKDGSILFMPPSFDNLEAQTARVQAANYLAEKCHLVTGPDGERVAELIARSST